MKSAWLAPVAMLSASISAQAAEISSTVTMTNDYHFRGISQTSGPHFLI